MARAPACVSHSTVVLFHKARPEHSMTKRSYTEAVLAGIAAAEATCSCECRLLLSIDR